MNQIGCYSAGGIQLSHKLILKARLQRILTSEDQFPVNSNKRISVVIVEPHVIYL